MNKNLPDWLGATLGYAVVILLIVLFAMATGSSDPVPEAGNTLGGSSEPTYGSYECTEDCSGHDAGYEWAKDNDICDPDYSGGNSDSFAEGVVAYAYEYCYYSDGENPI